MKHDRELIKRLFNEHQSEGNLLKVDFNSSRKRATVAYLRDSGEMVRVVTIGASELILHRCNKIYEKDG